MVDYKNKGYGLVLEGGGTRGAYEIGVWKAIEELNIQIDAVVGTSIGAINGALFVQNDLEKALEIWNNIRYSKVIEIEDRLMLSLENNQLRNLSISDAIKGFSEIVKNKGLDITPLKKLLEEVIDEEVIRESPVDFGLTTFNLTDMQAEEHMIDDIEPNCLVGYLLASSYLPAFKAERIFGKRFIDGAVHNVAPISMLVNKGYKDIIVVRIHGVGIEKAYDDRDVNVIEIKAREDLGGLLEFDLGKIKKNIHLGYYDAKRIFLNGSGNRYFLSDYHTEVFFLKQFLKLSKRSVVRTLLDIGGKSSMRGYKHKERLICEVLLPFIGKELKLKKDASYEDIYVELLENAAELLGVERFKQYTFKELKMLVNQEIEAGNLETVKDKALYEIYVNLFE
jgi:NTE family protein